MRENVITAPPELKDEINRALGALKKGGYKVTSQQDASGGLSLDFRFGATEQCLKFGKEEWQKPGAVERRIIDKLEI